MSISFLKKLSQMCAFFYKVGRKTGLGAWGIGLGTERPNEYTDMTLTELTLMQDAMADFLKAWRGRQEHS